MVHLDGGVKMKAGDLVRWRADQGIGIITKVTPGYLELLVDIRWFTGLGTGRIPSDHVQLEVISESR
jgi:hypothetical protein